MQAQAHRKCFLFDLWPSSPALLSQDLFHVPKTDADVQSAQNKYRIYNREKEMRKSNVHEKKKEKEGKRNASVRGGEIDDQEVSQPPRCRYTMYNEPSLRMTCTGFYRPRCSQTETERERKGEEKRRKREKKQRRWLD